MNVLAKAEAQLDLKQRFRIAKARALRSIARIKFDPSEPRDDAGKWTSGGGGGDTASSSDKPDDADHHLDPKVIQVGGDSWNKATARRLEREYQSAKPALDALTAKYAGLDHVPDTTPEEMDEDAPAPPPESWDELSSSQQDDAFEKYKEQKLSQYLENEQQNWVDNGDALDTAKVILADDPSKDDWLQDALKEHLDDSDSDIRFPLTAEQLANAIVLEYDSGNEGHGKLTVSYLDKSVADYVAENTGASADQQTLPGIEPEDLSKKLTDEMRDELNGVIEKAFDKKADGLNVDPPDYLSDSAAEFLEEDWNHGLDDDAKWQFVKNDTDIVEDNSGGSTTAEEITGLPQRYDPLNATTGMDYKQTQKLARVLSIQRSQEVLKARNLPVPDFTDMHRIDSQLWSSWKSSSTSPNGKLLQLASADELGGRLNPKTGRNGSEEINREEMTSFADKDYKAIGGYAGVKAYIRAKWETTQYLLDKAGIPELKLYRGIALDQDKLDQAHREKLLALKQMVGDHVKVPNLVVVRNGAASTTTDPGVANGWSQDASRLVLRAQIPRTAALSIPAYGINVQSEHEVVVTGTAWKGWDAWLGKAPQFEQVAMAA